MFERFAVKFLNSVACAFLAPRFTLFCDLLSEKISIPSSKYSAPFIAIIAFLILTGSVASQRRMAQQLEQFDVDRYIENQAPCASAN